ncbi:MAG: CDP-alcohol phosphatidyltransferase family protein [Azospirillaceae bacterium]
MRPAVVLVNAVTLAGLAAGLAGIAAGLAGRPDIQYPLFALCLIADGVDGPMARLLGAETRFGRYADAASDFTVFGVGGAVALSALAPTPAGAAILLATWPVAAAARLGLFLRREAVPGLATGLPLPAAALALIALGQAGPVQPSPGALVLLAAAATVLMLSRVTFSRSPMAYAVGLAAGGAAALALGVPAVLLPMAACAGYVALGTAGAAMRGVGLGKPRPAAGPAERSPPLWTLK